MIILSHRGYWNNKFEQNSGVAFKRSFLHGFGVETDIRDYKGSLVISHEIADRNSMSLDEFFCLYNKYGTNLPLALNIKADGLQKELKKLIEKHNIKNYFVFDMSIPDTLVYLKFGMNVLMRWSEYEHESTVLNGIDGIWLDQFQTNWYDKSLVEGFMEKWGLVCAVSPELHGRDHKSCWILLAKASAELGKEMMICTDHPLQAEEFFNAE